MVIEIWDLEWFVEIVEDFYSEIIYGGLEMWEAVIPKGRTHQLSESRVSPKPPPLRSEEMSWGERSCKNKPCPIPDECTMFTCNVNCRMYEWDGKTKPDSSKAKTMAVELAPKLNNEQILNRAQRRALKRRKK